MYELAFDASEFGGALDLELEEHEVALLAEGGAILLGATLRLSPPLRPPSVRSCARTSRRRFPRRRVCRRGSRPDEPPRAGNPAR